MIEILNQLVFNLFKLLEQAESERNRLRELLVRHSELEKVEKSIVEVRDMFLRISTLVIEQVHLDGTENGPNIFINVYISQNVLFDFVESFNQSNSIFCASSNIEH